MLKPEQVPDGPARAYFKALEAAKSWRECFAAAINAWPGAHKWDTGEVWHQAAIVLPLPQETDNVEA